MTRYEPLQVRMWLRTPVVSNLAMPLDGILQYEAMRRANGPRDTNVPGGVVAEEATAVELPLACVGTRTPDWFYACSWAQWGSRVIEGKSAWTKRLSTHRLEVADLGRKSKVQVSKGEFRSYLQPTRYRAVPSVHWYVVGDREGIDDLLRTVWAIGKERGEGWGRVARYEVRPWPEDWSCWLKGRAMRAMPVSSLKAWEPGNVREYGFRPPYWMRENRALCLMPGGEGE